MKRLILVFALFLCPIFTVLVARENEQCTHCHLNMQDVFHQVSANDGVQDTDSGLIPMYENYDGIQMDEDFSLNLEIKYEVL